MHDENIAERFCEERGLNQTLLKKILLCRATGFNNSDCAKKLGVHRATVQRYVEALRETKEDEMKMVLQELFGQQITVLPEVTTDVKTNV